MHCSISSKFWDDEIARVERIAPFGLFSEHNLSGSAVHPAELWKPCMMDDVAVPRRKLHPNVARKMLHCQSQPEDWIELMCLRRD